MTKAAIDQQSFAAPVERPSSRSSLYGILILALLCAFCAPFFTSSVEKSPVPIRSGLLELPRGKTLTTPIRLDGEWRFQWLSQGSGPSTMQVPGNWNRNDERLSENGLARYALTVKGLSPGIYRVHIASIFCANTVSINGELRSRRGVVGTDAATTRYYWRANDFTFNTDGRDLLFTIDAACFLHRDNGIETAPVIGTPDAMQEMFTLRWSQELLFQICLLMLSLYCIVVYCYRPSDKGSLLLGLACLCFSPVAAMLGFDNIILVAFPHLAFPALLAIVYMITGLSQYFFLSYAHALFPQESPRKGYLGVAWMVILFFGAQGLAMIFSGTLLASRINAYMIFELALYFAYILWVLGRAVVRGKEGSLPFLVGISGFAVASMLMTLVAAGYISSDRAHGFNFTTYGILMLLFSHLVVLAERWARSISDTEQSNADLRQLLDVSASITSEMKLDSLLRQIVEATTGIVRAERSSLFLYDERTEELWSLYAQGVGGREIRFPATTGLAGLCLQTGEAVFEKDAYSNPLFNRKFDAESNFRTRSIICLPVTTRDGKKLGVMQALNKQGGGHFTEADLERMGAFAAQAAIALDNATLFGEIVAARNYNESILSSMSSGVFTFDQETRIARLNPAAAAIFDTELLELDARAVDRTITRNNMWLTVEIDSAMESNASKVMLDVELKTASGREKSVNLSIVPLINAEVRSGILVLIEDISEGKRLQGAMRRFMPQQVVDQVLERDDDLMFGSACQASILFADIRGFTALSEQLTPRQTVDMLNEVFTDLFEAVSANKGIVDKYIGDAVMAVFGVPFASAEDPANAVRGATAMLAALDVVNARPDRGTLPLRLGVGIATGEVVAGTIGSPKRMDYTVIGDSVNLASRMQDLTKTYGAGIIVCEETEASLPADINRRRLDLIRVRGRQTPVALFEVLLPGKDLAGLNAYARGLDLLGKRDWPAAEAAFLAATLADPDDMAAQMMLKRAQTASQNPPAADWDGVW